MHATKSPFNQLNFYNNDNFSKLLKTVCIMQSVIRPFVGNALVWNDRDL